ncbi:ABC transporter permease [Bordetella genomosp. 10]|uniref:ABC transporter permease n=1 Tax=Bordetella genomosp. 10 TaxID=1416804 RepID=A0A261SLA1_9BORD|nr:ABC transporter permease [Bordetella genomosp. 10]OZI37103.1 ABC transporter permease [Bordetella genomosp. 10]
MNDAVLPPRRRPRRNRAALALGIYTLCFMIFLLLPMIVVVVVSFSNASYIAFPIHALSLRWYRVAFEYGPFMQSLKVSLQIALGSALLGAILGVPAALWAARSHSPLAGAVSSFLLAPISVAAIVLGFSLLYMLSAMSLGVSFLSLMITHTVVAIPYIARTVLAVYRSVPHDIEEAAAVLGASRWNTFRFVTLPAIRPGIFAGGMFAVLISMDNLPLSFFFGSASTNTLPVVMLSYMQNQFDPSIAAISTIQMLIAVAALLVINKLYGIEKLTAA